MGLLIGVPIALLILIAACFVLKALFRTAFGLNGASAAKSFYRRLAMVATWGVMSTLLGGFGVMIGFFFIGRGVDPAWGKGSVLGISVGILISGFSVWLSPIISFVIVWRLRRAARIRQVEVRKTGTGAALRTKSGS